MTTKTLETLPAPDASHTLTIVEHDDEDPGGGRYIYLRVAGGTRTYDTGPFPSIERARAEALAQFPPLD